MRRSLTRSIPAHVSKHEKRPNLNSLFIPQTANGNNASSPQTLPNEKEQYRELVPREKNWDGNWCAKHPLMTCAHSLQYVRNVGSSSILKSYSPSIPHDSGSELDPVSQFENHLPESSRPS
ncbi:hypothetical protein NPIL_187691 [Nephila pilipes]|uniref:Uncharacterized protein n=1 Tax=Nephila pilipes TaxID=299642 RepID=A0A8X6NDY3_NEPPI|nr:hypothetical protein NPIL_187691 [Nephila pilipes]